MLTLYCEQQKLMNQKTIWPSLGLHLKKIESDVWIFLTYLFGKNALYYFRINFLNVNLMLISLISLILL